MKSILFIVLLSLSTITYALKVETQAISNDKAILALAFDDLVIRLYDLNSGKLLQELKSHENSIQTVSFNSDGSKLISGDWGDYAIIWDVATGKIFKKKNMGETVMHAIYSADDKFLIIAVDEQPLALFDTNLKSVKGTYAINDRLQLSQNKGFLVGQQMYSPNVSGDAVIVVDLKSNKSVMEIPEDSYDDDIYFSKDASIIVIRGGSSMFHVWDAIDKNKIGIISTELNVDESLINPVDDKQLWVAGDNKIEIWDYRTQKIIKAFDLKGLEIDEVSKIAFSPDGKFVAISVWLESDISKVLVVNTTDYSINWQIKPMSKQAFTLEYIDNDNLLLNSIYPIEVWDIRNKQLKHLFTKSGSKKDKSLQEIFKAEFNSYRVEGSINGIDSDGKGNVIVTGAESLNTSISMDEKGRLSSIFQNNYITGYDARYSHDGELAAFAYHGEHLLIYKTIDGSLYANLDLGGVPNGFRIVKFSSDDSLLAVGSDDGSVYIVDVKAKESVKHVKLFKKGDYSEGTFSLQWLNNNKLVVGTLESIFELEVSSGEYKKVWKTGATALQAYFNNDKMQYLAVGQYEDELILLDANYEKIKTSKYTGVGRLSVSTDGKKLIALTDYKAIIWDVNKNKYIECRETDENLWAMAYDANKHRIYVGGDEGKVYIYNEACKELNK